MQIKKIAALKLNAVSDFIYIYICVDITASERKLNKQKLPSGVDELHCRRKGPAGFSGYGGH